MADNNTFEEGFNNTYTDNSTFNGTFNGTFNSTYSNSTNGTFTGAEEKVETIPISFYTPIIYAVILIVSLMIFSRRYKANRIRKLAEQPEIFDEHEAKELYFELQELSTTEKIHEKVLKAALLNRGAEAIRRTLKLKELTPQIELMYKNGSVGEDYWERFQAETKFVEVEFRDTIQEAENLQPGWPKMFAALCQEICFNQALSRRYQSILKRKEVCIEEWDLKINSDGTLTK